MPFNGAPDDEKPGYVIELLREIFGPESLDYATMPWEDALKAARAGEISAVIGANPTEAEGLLIPKEAIGEPRIALFVSKASSWQYENIKSLRSIRLGVIAGYSYWESLDVYLKRQNGDKIVILSGDSPLLDGIKQLDAGEIDVLPESIAVFSWNLKALGKSLADYRISYAHVGEAIYVAFANNEAGHQNLDRFDTGMKALRASGKLAAILKRYGQTDWE